MLCTSVQFSPVTQLCPTLCNPMDCSPPGFPVHHQLLELAQTHVHLVSDAIQPLHLLSSPSPSAFNPSQHQGLYKWVSSSYQVAKVLELQHQFFQWISRTDFSFRMDWFDLLAILASYLRVYELPGAGGLPCSISSLPCSISSSQ